MKASQLIEQLHKPRIKRDSCGWSCQGLGKEGNGATPRGAYFDWLLEALLPPYDCN